MNFIEWRDDLNTNIAHIDNQHKKLVGIINKLHDAMNQGTGGQVLESVFVELENYAKVHFNDEENLLAAYKYPELDGQKTQHLEFIEKIGKLRKDFDRGRMLVSIDVLNFLRDWLLKHIKFLDMKYVPYLVSKGVS
jgi:hemerythrin-like metal-binding protein